MDFYRRSYHTLFNAITDALRAMEDQNFGLAREQLIRSRRFAKNAIWKKGQRTIPLTLCFSFFTSSNPQPALRSARCW